MAKDSQDAPQINSEQFPSSEHVKFTCPNCGEIPQEDVIFLCNHCKQGDLVYKDGLFLCPECLKPGHNFQCMLCEATNVTMEHTH